MQKPKKILLLPFFPLVVDYPDDGERECRQVKNAGVQTFGRLLTQLLGSSGTNRALCPGYQRGQEKSK